MTSERKWMDHLPAEDDQVAIKVITHQPMGSLKEKRSSLLGKTADTSCAKYSRCSKRVRFHGSVTVVVVDYMEDGASSVSRVSSQLLRDGADADTGRTLYRTSSFERLHPISKYLCFGK